MADKSLLDRLKEYGASDAYPFHMPGHKRQYQFPNPFSIDITEIHGFDNLYYPEGIIKDSLEWAARLYGADKTYYLVNGSSSGILSAVSAVTESGGTILISRNCHKAVYHGVFLRKLKTVYSYPQVIAEYGILGGLLAAEIEELLINNREIQAVLMVSPTYDGVVSDIRAIADTVHGFGIPLIVDEAHGAHLPFGEDLKSALEMGADIVIQSVHKTLPALTQTAVLHVRSELVDQKRLERFLQIYQSSSPSYVLMSSIEAALDFMQHEGRERLIRLGMWIDEMYEILRGLKVLKMIGPEFVGQAGVFAFDRTKLLFYVPGCVRCLADGRQQRVDGVVLADILRDEYQIELELCAINYVMALAACMDRREGFLRLTKALLEIDGQLQKGAQWQDEAAWQAEAQTKTQQPADTDADRQNQAQIGIQQAGTVSNHAVCRYPQPVMTIADAWNGPTEPVLWENCENRISAEFIYVYPPGIPVAVPGEVMTAALKEQIELYWQSGLTVHGGGKYLDCVRNKDAGEQ